NNPVPVTVQLEIITGRGVEFYWPTRDLPIFRSFAVSGESINFSYSNIEGWYNLKGGVAISGGELFYFEQDFNIRQGNISFNENETKKFDPLVNINGEFKSIIGGDPIRIYLDIEDDNISQLQPIFSSDPIRSQEDLVFLLGGKIVGNEEDDNVIDLGSALASGTQLLGQIRLLNDLENELRQTLNLDVLSLRFGLVQNIIERAVDNPLDSTVDPVSLGEYLDNTTLRIGRYLGDDIFFEGSIQLEESDTFDRAVNDQIGLTIYPEIRLEFETPIFTLNWSWAILDDPETLSVRGHRITFIRDFFFE
ncbi:MAG: translocation/assembly module TamB domain-containing protein, partial [Salinispira sp.]